MADPGSWITTAAFLLITVAVSIGGHGPLVSLLGIIAGVNLLTVGVWLHEHSSHGATLLPTAFCGAAERLRRNLAVVGMAAASLAVTSLVATPAASPTLCFALLVLLLLGICLVTLAALLA